MNGTAEGRWLGISKRKNYCTEKKRTPSLRMEVVGADTTGLAVASRYSSIELRRLRLLPKRALRALRRPKSTALLLSV